MNKRIRKKQRRRTDELIQEVNIFIGGSSGGIFGEAMMYSTFSGLPPISKKAIKRYKRKRKKFDPTLD